MALVGTRAPDSLLVITQQIKVQISSLSMGWDGGLGTDKISFLKFHPDRTKENSQRMWQNSLFILGACLLLLCGHSPGVTLKEKQQWLRTVFYILSSLENTVVFSGYEVAAAIRASQFAARTTVLSVEQRALNPLSYRGWSRWQHPCGSWSILLESHYTTTPRIVLDSYSFLNRDNILGLMYSTLE